MKPSERTLRTWRAEALKDLPKFTGEPDSYVNARKELNRRILLMTQVLLDQHLLSRKP